MGVTYVESSFREPGCSLPRIIISSLPYPFRRGYGTDLLSLDCSVRYSRLADPIDSSSRVHPERLGRLATDHLDPLGGREGDGVVQRTCVGSIEEGEGVDADLGVEGGHRDAGIRGGAGEMQGAGRGEERAEGSKG